MKTYILYNPTAGHKCGKLRAEMLAERIGAEDSVCLDLTELSDYTEFFKGLSPEDKVVLCGGDGTLNKFSRAVNRLGIKNDLFYTATGNGNDFMKDLELPNDSDPIRVNDYITKVPFANIGGEVYPVLNGVGIGLDGHCCLEGEEHRKRSNKPFNYTLTAIKGVFYKFKPRIVRVTVDGVSQVYKNVWIVSVMNGRYYGGGLMIAPAQKRCNEGSKMSVVIVHGKAKFRTLLLFPPLFKGEHVKYTDRVTILTGNSVKVELHTPTPLQIDGEPMENITSFSATSSY